MSKVSISAHKFSHLVAFLSRKQNKFWRIGVIKYNLYILNISFVASLTILSLLGRKKQKQSKEQINEFTTFIFRVCFFLSFILSHMKAKWASEWSAWSEEANDARRKCKCMVKSATVYAYSLRGGRRAQEERWKHQRAILAS